VFRLYYVSETARVWDRSYGSTWDHLGSNGITWDHLEKWTSVSPWVAAEELATRRLAPRRLATQRQPTRQRKRPPPPPPPSPPPPMGRAVQDDSIKHRVESAPGISA